MEEEYEDDLEEIVNELGMNIYQVVFSYEERTHEVHTVAAVSEDQVRQIISDSFNEALKVRKDLFNLQFHSITPYQSPTLQ